MNQNKYPPQSPSDLVGVVRIQMVPFTVEGAASFYVPGEGVEFLPGSVVRFPTAQDGEVYFYTARLPLGYKPTLGKIRIRFRTDAEPAAGKQVRFVVTGGVIASGGADVSTGTVVTPTNIDLDTYTPATAAAEVEFVQDFIDQSAVDAIKSALTAIGQSDAGTFLVSVEREGTNEGDDYPGDVLIASVCVDLDTGPF
jgi:hypothetical protein